MKEFSRAEELRGSLSHSETMDKLMRSVLENDQQLIDEGHVLADGISHGLHSFTPEMLFEQLVKDYRQAKELYGQRLIRQLSGYEPGYVERNIRIPEFRRELKGRLQQSVKSFEDHGLIDKEGKITDEGLTIASLSMTVEELSKLKSKGALGERASKIKGLVGEKADYDAYRSHHRYRDLALKATVKKAIRRGHGRIAKEDLTVHERLDRQRATVIYAIDASGSMKGEKLASAKRAGIALGYKATQKGDRVGVVIFGREVTGEQRPTAELLPLIKVIVAARAARETDIAATIRHAQGLFDNSSGLKHLVLLTDGLQTVGEDPVAAVLEAASSAAACGVTISVIGLRLDEEGELLSRRLVDVGKGTLYLVKSYDDLDLLLIEDYYHATGRSGF